MPLKGAVAGNGKIIQKTVSVRRYTVGEQGSFFTYRETTQTEARIWTALTKAAAEAQIAQNAQPSDPLAVYTWSARLDNREVGSYIVQRDYQKVTTVRV
jgi:hypothetical protein